MSGWQSPQEVQEKVKDRLSNIIWANRTLSRLQEHPGGKELIKNGLVQSLDPLLELRTPPAESEDTMDEFAKKNGLDLNVVHAFSKYLFDKPSSETRLWKHQCKATELLKLPHNNDGIIMATPTASGKTEAALLPILNDIHVNRERQGVRALFIYPTKTLGTDQTKRFVKVLNKMNTLIAGRNVTLALLDGDADTVGTFNQPARGLPCPDCNEILEYSGAENYDVKCRNCGHDHLSWLFITKKRIYENKNDIDILITNPEMLERRFLPGESNVSLENLDYIVYDEAHHWRGSPGASIRFLNSRLKYRSPQARFILLSATVKKPERLFSDLTSIDGFKSDVREYVVKVEDGKNLGTDTNPDISKLPRVHNWPLLIQILVGHSNDILHEQESLIEFIENNKVIINKFFPQIIGKEGISSFKNEILETGWWTESLKISSKGREFVSSISSKGWEELDWYENINTNPIKKYFETLFDSEISNGRAIIEYVRDKPFRTLNYYTTHLNKIKWPNWAKDDDGKEEAIHCFIGLSRIAELSRDKYHIWYRTNTSILWDESKETLIIEKDPTVVQYPAYCCGRCGAALYSKDGSNYIPIPFETGGENCKFCEANEKGISSYKSSKIPLEDIGLLATNIASYISSALYHDLGIKKHLVFSDSVKSAESLSRNLIEIEPSLFVGRYLLSLYSDDATTYKIFDLQDKLDSELKKQYFQKYTPHIQNLEDARLSLNRIYNRDIAGRVKYSHQWKRVWDDLVLAPKIPIRTDWEWFDWVAFTTIFRHLITLRPYAGQNEGRYVDMNETLSSDNPFTTEPKKIYGMPWKTFTLGSKKIKGLRDKLIGKLVHKLTFSDNEKKELEPAFDKAFLLAFEIGLIREANDQDQNMLTSNYQNFQDLMALSKESLTKDFQSNFKGSGWFVSEYGKLENIEIEIPQNIVVCTTCFRPKQRNVAAPGIWLCGDSAFTEGAFCPSCGSNKLVKTSRKTSAGFSPIKLDTNEFEMSIDHNAKEFSDYLPQSLMAFSHTGGQEKGWRAFIELAFKKSLHQVTSSTPTFELGIDLGGLNATTMIGVPPYQSNYVQRTGRAGRSRPEPSYCFTAIRTESPRDHYHFASPSRMRNYIITDDDIYIEKARKVPEVLLPHVLTEILIAWLSERENLERWKDLSRLTDQSLLTTHRITRSLGLLISTRMEYSLLSWTKSNVEVLSADLKECFGGREMGAEVDKTISQLLDSEKDLKSIIDNWYTKFNQRGIGGSESIFELMQGPEGGQRIRFFQQKYPDLLSVLQDRGLFSMYRFSSSTVPEYSSGSVQPFSTRSEDNALRVTPPPEPEIYKSGDNAQHPKFWQQMQLKKVKYVALNEDKILNNPIYCRNTDCIFCLKDVDRPDNDACPVCGVKYPEYEFERGVSEISHISIERIRGQRWRPTTSSVTSHIQEASDSTSTEKTIKINDNGPSMVISHAVRELIEYVNEFRVDGAKKGHYSAVIINKNLTREGITPSNIGDEDEEENYIEGVYHAGRKTNTGILEVKFDDETELEEGQQLNPDNIGRMVSFIHALISAICVTQHVDRDNLDFHISINGKGQILGYVMETVRGNQGALKLTFNELSNLNSRLVERLQKIKECGCGSYCPKCLMHGRGIDLYLKNNLISIQYLKEIL